MRQSKTLLTTPSPPGRNFGVAKLSSPLVLGEKSGANQKQKWKKKTKTDKQHFKNTQTQHKQENKPKQEELKVSSIQKERGKCIPKQAFSRRKRAKNKKNDPTP